MWRKFVFNNEYFKFARTRLRKNQTEAEEVLWTWLRARKTGFKWYRQYSVDKFILDFYCPKRKLGVELDGGQHRNDVILNYDKNRSEYLKSLGIRVLRFKNEEVLKNVDGVVTLLLSPPLS